MHFKTDTKEKFSVITPEEQEISANMADELMDYLHSFLQRPVPHVIFNAKHIERMADVVLTRIIETQQLFYSDNHSFVVCELSPEIIEQLKKQDLLDEINATPTESEAWDIVQMEEIERELLKDFED